MARKQSKPGPKPDPQSLTQIRTAAIMVRARPEWKAWVERLAEHDRTSAVVDIIDKALVAYGRQIGFPEAAPKR